jgi:hypothetical protein
MQARESTPYKRIPAGISLSKDSRDVNPMIGPPKDFEFKYHVPGKHNVSHHEEFSR